jgi:glutathione S-transferase
VTGAPVVRLFGHWICPYSVRVEFALAHRGIDRELVEVPPTAARPRGFVVPEPFVANSARGEIPLLQVGDRFLADSIPILLWLEAEFDRSPLLPADPAGRALALGRARWLDEHLYPAMVGVYYGHDPARIAADSDRAGAALAGVEGWLAAGDWLAGAAPSLAEAVMAGFYTRLDGLGRLGLTAPLPPKVAAHLDRCRSLRGWERAAWSPGQTDEFVARFTAYRAKRRREATAV